MAQMTAGAGEEQEVRLPAVAGGAAASTVRILRFGEAGARPKAYLQAGLHADEFPGMLALRHLAARMREAAARGDLAGEVILVPQANPIGLQQHRFGFLQGRFEEAGGENFNRHYTDLASAVAPAVAGKLGADAAANVEAIRAAMRAALAAAVPEGALDLLRHTLLSLACDADFVLDLHADNDALVHLYMGTPLWPDARDLAAEIGARVVLLAEESGGRPFDEAVSTPWWILARTFPEHAIPPACLSATVELGCNDDVDDAVAARQAAALFRFLVARGVVRGAASAHPPLQCEATDLEAMQQVRSPAEGLIHYLRPLGDVVGEGEPVAEIIDPLGAAVPVPAATSGILFARHSQTYAWPGKVIGKIAGVPRLAGRTGNLLTE